MRLWVVGILRMYMRGLCHQGNTVVSFVTGSTAVAAPLLAPPVAAATGALCLFRLGVGWAEAIAAAALLPARSAALLPSWRPAAPERTRSAAVRCAAAEPSSRAALERLFREGDDNTAATSRPGVITDLPLWRVQWPVLPGFNSALNVHVPHYTHMFSGLVASCGKELVAPDADDPWLAAIDPSVLITGAASCFLFPTPVCPAHVHARWE